MPLLPNKWEIDSPAPFEQVREVLAWVDRGCHTLNTIRQPVPVEGRAEVNGQATDIEQRVIPRSD